MGMNFEVQLGREYHRVTDVAGGSFVLRGKDGLVRVSVDGKVGFRITQQLKLASVAAEIKDLKAERSYTPANDPRRKWLGEQALMTGVAADNVQVSSRSLAAAQATAESTARRAQANPLGPGAMAAELAAAEAQAGRAQREFGSAMQQEGILVDSGRYLQRMEEELKQELYDAVDVSFEISTPRPLGGAYVIVVVQFHDPKAPANVAQNWIYAEAFDRLDVQPRKFRVSRGGFPRGFALERMQVHVYDRGQEIASTVAAKRVELTAEEAHQYLVIEHVAANKGQDAAAVVALANLPAGLREHLAPGDFDRTWYAQVDPAGLATGVFTDEACQKPLANDYLAAVVRRMRFLPALGQGTPVAGVAAVKLAEIRN